MCSRPLQSLNRLGCGQLVGQCHHVHHMKLNWGLDCCSCHKVIVSCCNFGGKKDVVGNCVRVFGFGGGLCIKASVAISQD